MNLFTRIFKFLQSEAHSLVSKFEDPVKLIEQGIRDLKTDFDESIKSIAQIKAISIQTKKELDAKKQIAADYEQKALLLLQKAKNNELDEAEADRLATIALTKRQEALAEIKKLQIEDENYDKQLDAMNKKVLELKDKIKNAENEYKSLKARATVAKTTKKINQKLSSISSDSTLSMIEDMKKRISEEENLAEAYGEINKLDVNEDEEINKAIGVNSDVQKSLLEMKQKLIEAPTDTKSIEELKRELES